MRVLRERANSLSPEIDLRTSSAIEGVEELLRLLEEQRTLESAADTLDGAGRDSSPQDERGFLGIRDPLVRAERALRELRSIDRYRELEREVPGVHSSTGQSRQRRQSGREEAERIDIVKEAEEFASTRAGVIPLHEFAEHILKLAPNRYRNTATAQASLYYHLGKSEKFAKAGPSMYRLVAYRLDTNEGESPAESSPSAEPRAGDDLGDLPFGSLGADQTGDSRSVEDFPFE